MSLTGLGCLPRICPEELPDYFGLAVLKQLQPAQRQFFVLPVAVVDLGVLGKAQD